MNKENLLKAEYVTSVTLVGICIDNYPVSSGNCFSVHTKSGDYRIVNFSHENLEEIIRRGINFPMTILTISNRVALIHDERIPNNWYDMRYCEVCCPEQLLPIQQQLTHDREEKQGVRKVSSNVLRFDRSKCPDLGN